MVIFHRYVTYVSLPEGNSTTSKGRKTGFWGCRLKTKLSWNVSGETTLKATVFLLCNLVLPHDAGTWRFGQNHFESPSRYSLLGEFPNGVHPLLHLTRLDAFCSPTELSQRSIFFRVDFGLLLSSNEAQ